jgi:tRNA-specific 2-thiouridylase
MRVVVAMSGGVDSSVAAALLQQQGHDVIGLSMQLYDQRGDQSFGSCCSIDDLHDARRVAAELGFPHYLLNFERQFQETVVANFVGEYAAGRTPIPCAHCNSDLKFATLVERALGLGASVVATGHYARVDRAADGTYRLRRGADPDKDQSYFLFSLTQTQLAHAAFPVGGLTKDEVRDEARRLNLRVADKPDSQEICFVPDGDYASFVTKRLPDAPREGAIVDAGGQTLGTHDGVHRFTVGQRKGLGLSAPAPLYVLRIDAASRQVTVGPRAALEQARLWASGVNWISGTAPDGWRRIAAQIRHRHAPAAGRVRALPDGRAEVEFDAPQVAITPGQAVVFYDRDLDASSGDTAEGDTAPGDTVLGGGWIDRAE